MNPNAILPSSSMASTITPSSSSSSSMSAVATAAVLAASAGFAAGVASGIALYQRHERRQRQQALASTAPLDPRDPESLRESAAGLVDLIARYRRKLYSRELGDPKTSYAVRTQIAPGSIVAQLPATCPESPESYASIFKDCEEIIFPGLTHWSSPNFMAYFKVCGGDPSALADLLCASLNVVGFTWVAAPAATELEIVMCDWVARLMGLPDCFLSTSPGGGVIQTTASDSLLCAMIAARNRALEGLEGQARVDKASRLVMYVSDQTHSIGGKGCLVLDLPHLRVIPTRRGATDPDNYGLHPDDVAAAMQEDMAAGLVPFMLVPTVGTTSTTAIDPVRALVAVARQQREPVWVHIDGAYGGAAAICPEFRHWLDGVELVDSLCINPHKWLMVAMDCQSALGARPPAADPGARARPRVPQERLYVADQLQGLAGGARSPLPVAQALVHAASLWCRGAARAHPPHDRAHASRRVAAD
ncbi:hypothetical protein PINS_up018232 [Pythium insidiosum]|nr:hypothetical protein PINS_up018232 [Pythium insidiosum]